MKNRHSDGGSRVKQLLVLLAGLLLGALAGAVVMLLLAPQSGEKTWSQMQKQGEKLQHQAAEGLDDAVTEAGDKAHQFTDSVQNGVGELQHQAKKLIKESTK